MSYQSPPTIPTSPPIKSHSAIGYWNLPAIMIAHFRFHTSTLYPTSISSCRINVLNSFLMGGKEISSRRCKCKWKPNCSNASELQTLQRTNITHIFILYIFEMLKVQNHECHESWKIQGVPEKNFAFKMIFCETRCLSSPTLSFLCVNPVPMKVKISTWFRKISL